MPYSLELGLSSLLVIEGNVSGIYGFATQKRAPDANILIKRMRDALPSHGPSTNHHWVGKQGNIGLGAIHPVRIGATGHFAEESVGLCCVLDGIIFRDSPAPGESPVECEGASLLIRRYLESGTDCFRQLSGSFSAALWDAKAGRLVVANDKLGHRLLFFGHHNGTLVFASYLARVLATDIIPRQIDVEGFADLISYEHVLGERTLFEDVRSLPPAGILTYDSGHIDIKEYWRLDEMEPHLEYDEHRVAELEELFKTAVRRSVRPHITTAIDLTGGLDSRCILAAAANMQLSFVTHTGGQSASTDVVLAQQAAQAVRAKHIFEPIGPERMAEWLIPMVAYQSGIVSTLHSHPCQHFDMPLPFDAVVQGIGISYVRGQWVSPANLDIDNFPAAVCLLRLKMASNTARHMDLRRVWRPECQTIAVRSVDDHLNRILAKVSIRDRPVAILDYIALRERCRKFLNKAIMIVRASREAYFPYLDHEFIMALANMPISERVNNKIQVDLIRRLFPELLDIPSTKTLLPMSASREKVWIMRRYWGIKRRIFNQLGLPNRTPAIIPNHDLYEWTRDGMRKTLLALLYNPRAAFRAYLDWQTVEFLLDQHFSGKRNWEDFVGALTVFEIVHRLWVDPDPSLGLAQK